MIKLIQYSDSEQWDTTVKSFSNYDVYYLHGYVTAFRIHGDGYPVLLFFDNGHMRALYVAMLRDIAEFPQFVGILEPSKYFDIISPYGYGGFIMEGDISDSSVSQLNNELLEMCEQRIVSNFTRFSPVLQNAELSRSFMEVLDLGKTIALDLSSDVAIWENIISKNRNMIRKAIKNGVEIYHTHDNPELFNIFREIYNMTMDADNALDYYYFSKQFYESIHRDLSNNYELFYATFDDEIIAMAIMLFANGKMHYHLSGSKYEYRKLAPSNLLLYKAALWGYDQGFKVFHLGGGVGSGEDSLYKFKAAFNRNSDYQFSIGKQILNQEVYDRLVGIRKAHDISFNENSSFFPLYRS